MSASVNITDTIKWTFSNTFPLPYRALMVLVIGIWSWGLNLHILSLYSIDASAVLCIKRVIFSGFGSEVYFSDVIMADILTSFAKVLGDLYVTGCILLFYDVEQSGASGNRCYSYIIAPMLTRFRQCLTEYIGSDFNNKHHLFNAIKYCSAFPVIIFSALQKLYKYEALTESSIIWLPPPVLLKLWVLSVAFNSIYSFYWDVAKDWNLEFFTPTHPKSYIPSFKLRQNLIFKDPVIYYIAIMMDFLLRFTWSLKLSSHLHIIHQLEGGVFLMEVLEVLRRCLWIFFRFENAWIEKFVIGEKGGGAGIYGPLNSAAKTSMIELNSFDEDGINNKESRDEEILE
ncbi:8401_t:CDS:2 [Entrophospora sp. SA101]|nr:10495_t:CDS:2 [Entrophospora sp. SA101]CAJ0878286.1 8401_t:CDS:2 [Entrophospora sp. SA101]